MDAANLLAECLYEPLSWTPPPSSILTEVLHLPLISYNVCTILSEYEAQQILFLTLWPNSEVPSARKEYIKEDQ